MSSRLFRAPVMCVCGFACFLFGAISEVRAWKPDRPIEIVVPTTAGGSFDKTARLIERIAREDGLVDVPISVINKAGGGGNVALAYLQQRPADGHSIMIVSTALLVNHILGRSPVGHRDLTPTVTLFHEYIATIVLTGSQLNTPAAFTAQLRKAPDEITFGFCCALGGGNHLAAAMLVKAVGGDVKRMKTVVFKGAGEVTAAVLGGHIIAASNAASNALGPVQQGQMKVLAVAAPAPLSGILKGVPTWRDQGLDVVMSLTRSLIGPKAMSPDRVQFWEELTHKIVRSTAWREELERNVWNEAYKNGVHTSDYLDAQNRLLVTLLGDVGLLPR